MSRSSKSAWLEGPGDLREADVEDVPVEGQSVRVRGLPAAYSNEASSESLEWRTWPNGEQTATVNTAKLEVLQFAHGCVEPTFTVEEATAVSRKFGPAFKKVVAKIDELSGIDKADIEAANKRFQGGDGSSDAVSNGASAGSGGPSDDVPVGVGDGHAGE
jgi:hypothetical protein